MHLSMVCRVTNLVKWWVRCCACLTLVGTIFQDKMYLASNDRHYDIREAQRDLTGGRCHWFRYLGIWAPVSAL
jgi:hypothetical protein